MHRRTICQLGAATFGSTLMVPFGASAQSVKTRKDVSSLAPNATDLLLYVQAVQAMKELSNSNATDPRGWRRQAQTHQALCPHGNWWFLPWHRAYISYFEQCCRDLVGPEFVLPYWDWTNNPNIPGPFWSRILNHQRRIGPNDGIPNEAAGRQRINELMASSSLTAIFSEATTSDDQRESAGWGDLESGPHNNVHIRIGGDMGGMLSPLDPIFWLHHANLDRLWESWSRGRGAGRLPSSPVWQNHALGSFYDPATRTNVSPPAREMGNAAKWGAVYDRYEASESLAAANLPKIEFLGGPGSIQLNQVARAEMGFPSAGVRVGKTMSASLPAGVELSNLLSRVATASARLDVPRPQTQLRINGVRPPTNQTVAMRIFLNCRNPSVNTPTDDPSFVQTVSFFGSHHGGLYRFSLNAEQTVRRLVAAGQYAPGQPVEVTLIAIDTANPTKLLPNAVVKAEQAVLVAAE